MQKLKKFICNHKFLLFLFFFSLLLRVFMVLMINIPVSSYYKTMYDASLELISHTESYKSSLPVLTFGYQLGHIFYQSILLSIVNSVLFLKIVNCVISSFTIVFIYLISKELSNKKAASIISIIYSIFLFPLLFPSLLSNQILSMLLVLIAIYLWIRQKRITVFRSIVIGILLVIAEVLQRDIFIIVIGFVFYLVFLIIKKKEKKMLFLSMMCIVSTFIILLVSTSYVFKVTGISPNGLANKNPAWRVLEGVHVSTNGRIQEDDFKYLGSVEKTKKELNRRIREDYLDFPKLFLNKIKTIWFSSDIGRFFNDNKEEEEIQFYIMVNQFFVYFFFIMSLLSVITIFKKIYKSPQIFISFILVSYFIYYLIVEVTPEYAYSLQILEAVLASITLGYILDKKKKGVEYGNIRR